MFPKASKSFYDANPISPPLTEDKTSSTASVGTGNGIRGKMNKTEESYSRVLDAMKSRSEIIHWEFQGITLRWKCGNQVIRYTPDFVVFSCNPRVEITPSERNYPAPDDIRIIYDIRLIEIKGSYRKMPGFLERAVERFRHAKTYWPQFEFELHQKTRQGWKQLL